MKNNELLQPSEKIKSSKEKRPVSKASLSQEKINELFTERNQRLNEIKSFVCLNFYHHLEEKIQREERSFLEILNYETGKNEVLKKYSFVLNPQYFEQKFFKTTY
ncbi:hypothetical protein COV49_03305 [Candidatus Falkowbacteria bacterium CG11_big_fil_rev_8_21_14_0_20_39_10]|uniref:Uncharacterized protein n=1 Tax=Candidatus Falkowbacteria bacterium CG11_big_fil_rev_8_21_14_0_20_39_10 TaxID=1974570 RepID=A0A2M6K8U9_9BACT|nr:MAG: hypothetical protein COV49_03305 [Candidatus Falkowbacteria bacterium CG11_big_fil_rev_8_21_14_0_20_39_10]